MEKTEKKLLNIDFNDRKNFLFKKNKDNFLFYFKKKYKDNFLGYLKENKDNFLFYF